MSYEWLDHTAELELRIEADDPGAVFADAAAAFSELVAQSHRGRPHEVEVTVAAPDRGALLAHWLDELIYLAETKGFVPDRIELVAQSHKQVRARLFGHIGEPRPIVKAVTYHGLSFEQHNGRWEASVVLDV